MSVRHNHNTSEKAVLYSFPQVFLVAKEDDDNGMINFTIAIMSAWVILKNKIVLTKDLTVDEKNGGCFSM